MLCCSSTTVTCMQAYASGCVCASTRCVVGWASPSYLQHNGSHESNKAVAVDWRAVPRHNRRAVDVRVKNNAQVCTCRMQ